MRRLAPGAGLVLAAVCALLPVQQATAAEAGGLLWKAQGRSNHVYLLGSLHMLKPEDVLQSRAVDAAFDDAEVLYFEIPPEDNDPTRLLPLVTTLAVSPDGRQLPDLIGQRDYERLSRRASEAGLALEPLAAFEPWFAAMTLSSMIMMQAGLSPDAGVEAQLAARAARAGKPVRGLETVEQQLGFLDQLPLDVQEEFLAATIDEAGEAGEAVAAMRRAWARGDAEALASEIEKDNGPEELRERLIDDRNAAWVRQILTLLQDHRDYLIVVGAAHLVGPGGVPALLEKRGVEVERE